MISAIGQTMGMDHAKELGSEFVPAEKFLDKPLKADTVLAAVWETLAARGTAPGDKAQEDAHVRHLPTDNALPPTRLLSYSHPAGHVA